jgi:DNA-binding XRE family transcriptional regulator
MKTKSNKTIRELGRMLGLTQAEFAAMIGASKDTVVTLKLETVPVWMPGSSMRGGRR